MPRCLRKRETDPCTLIPARTCRGRSCCVWACRHPRNSRSACASTQLAFPLVPYSACSLSRSRAVPPIPCRPDRRRAATGATRERALVNALARMCAPTSRPALTNAHASALAVGSARLVRVRCVHLTSRMGTCCSFRASCMACASTSTRTFTCTCNGYMPCMLTAESSCISPRVRTIHARDPPAHARICAPPL